MTIFTRNTIVLMTVFICLLSLAGIIFSLMPIGSPELRLIVFSGSLAVFLCSLIFGFSAYSREKKKLDATFDSIYSYKSFPGEMFPADFPGAFQCTWEEKLQAIKIGVFGLTADAKKLEEAIIANYDSYAPWQIEYLREKWYRFDPKIEDMLKIDYDENRLDEIVHLIKNAMCLFDYDNLSFGKEKIVAKVACDRLRRYFHELYYFIEHAAVLRQHIECMRLPERISEESHLALLRAFDIERRKEVKAA